MKRKRQMPKERNKRESKRKRLKKVWRNYTISARQCILADVRCLSNNLEPSAPLFQKRYSQDSTPEEEAKKKEKTQIFAGNTSFENFDLEPKLLKALNDSGFHLPTVIQNASIPPLLQGKDILIKVY